MNTEQLKNGKNDFKKDFSKLMNNAVFRKSKENVKKYRDIKLVTTKARKTYLVSKPNYHTTCFALENLLAIEIKKKKNTKTHE